MKLKYKKAYLLTILSSIGIGILTLSLVPNKIDDLGSKSIETSKSNALLTNNNTSTINLQYTEDSILEETTPIPTPRPTIIPTPTPLPIFDLEEDGYPKIETLILDYYTAKLSCDVSKMKNVLSNPINVPTKEQLQSDVKYIEDYNEIKCYTKKSYEEGTYIVFVYNEVVFINIATPAPALDQFYLVTDENGEIKIFSDLLSEKTYEYFNARNKDNDVQEIILMTNTKGEEAKEKDNYLRMFWNNLDEIYMAKLNSTGAKGNQSN